MRRRRYRGCGRWAEAEGNELGFRSGGWPPAAGLGEFYMTPLGNGADQAGRCFTGCAWTPILG
jgi:hypothetical protein